MPGQIDINQIFGSNTFTGINELNALLDKSVENLKMIVQEGEKVGVAFQGIKSNTDLVAATEKQKKVTQELNAEQKIAQQTAAQLEAAKAKLAQADSVQVQELARVKAAQTAKNKETRDAIKLEQAEKDAINIQTKSINDLKAKVAAMNKVRDNANLKTKEGRKQYKELTSQIAKTEKQVKKFDTQVGKSQRNVGNYSSAFKNLKSTLLAGFGLMALIRGLKDVIKKVADFSKANSDLAAVLGKTKFQIRDLTKDALKYGKSTAYAATQVTELQTELAKLGFSKLEIKESTADIIDFSVAVEADAAASAKVAGSALRAMGYEASRMGEVVSTLAVATTKSALSFSDYESSLSTVLPVAKAFNYSLPDSIALLGGLKDAGFEASAGATATRNILLNLANANGPLAKALGGSVNSLDELIPAFIKLREEGIDLNQALQLTDKRSVAAFSTFLQGAEKTLKLRDSITDVNKELGQMVDTKMDNLTGDTKLLASAWEGFILGIEDGTGSLAVFARNAIQFITEFVQGLESMTQSQADKAAAHAEAVTDRAKENAKSAMTEIETIAAKLNASGAYENEAEAMQRAFELYSSSQQELISNLEKEKEEIEGIKINIFNKKETNQKLDEINDKLREAKNEFSFTAVELQKTVAELGTANEDLATLTEGQINAFLEALKMGVVKEGEELRALTAAEIAKVAALKKAGYFKAREDSLKNDEMELKALREGQAKQLETLRVNYEKIRLELDKAGIDSVQLTEQYEEQKAKVLSDGADDVTQQEIVHYKARANKTLELLGEQYKNEEITANEYQERKKISIQQAEAEVLSMSIAGEQAIIDNKTVFDALSEEEKQKHYENLNILQQQQTDEAIKQEQAAQDEANNIRLAAYNLQTEQITANQQKQVLATVEALKRKEISEQEYYDRLKDIDAEAQQSNLDNYVSFLEQQLAEDELNAEERIKIENQIRDAKIAASQEAAEQQKADSQAAIDATLEQLNQVSQMASSIGSAVNDIYSAQMTSIENNYGRRLALAEGDAEKTEALEIEKARAVARIQRKQALITKATSLFSIAVNTAQSISKVTAEAGLAAPLLIPAFVALGLIQAAAVIAEPLPEVPAFAKGTQNAPGGLAVVGEKGSEIYTGEGGKAFLSPDRPTFVSLEKHGKVFTAEQTRKILSEKSPEMSTFASNIDRSLLYNFERVNNHSMKVDFAETNKRLDKVINAVKRIPGTTVTGNIDFQRQERSGNYMKKYFS